jgi:hypothetical protein
MGIRSATKTLRSKVQRELASSATAREWEGTGAMERLTGASHAERIVLPRDSATTSKSLLERADLVAETQPMNTSREAKGNTYSA